MTTATKEAFEDLKETVKEEAKKEVKEKKKHIKRTFKVTKGKLRTAPKKTVQFIDRKVSRMNDIADQNDARFFFPIKYQFNKMMNREPMKDRLSRFVRRNFR